MTITESITTPVLALYEAFAAADLDAIAALLTDDVVVHVPGHQPLSGDHAGPDGVCGFLVASQIATEGQEHIEVLDVCAGATHVAALCRITGRRPDRDPLDNRTVHVVRVEGGRVAEIWFHNFDQDNVDQFWS